MTEAIDRLNFNDDRLLHLLRDMSHKKIHHMRFRLQLNEHCIEICEDRSKLYYVRPQQYQDIIRQNQAS